MNDTLTFYSVSVQQMNILLNEYNAEKDGNVVSGDTPLGHIKMEYSYNAGSGQLSMTVLEKPPFLLMHTIEFHIKAALAQAAIAAEERAGFLTSEPAPVIEATESAPPQEVTPVEAAPAEIPSKTEDSETTESVR